MKDLARIFVKAGDGGNGSVHFRHEKFAPKGGPDGGDGGKGGDVILVADENIASLVEFNFQKKFEAKNGEQGFGKKMHGKDMLDITVHVPVGTVVWEIPEEMAEADMRDREVFEEVIKTRKMIMDMKVHNAKCEVAYGGRGGRGNFHFRSASNQVPMEHDDGKPGEAKWLVLELKVVADIGIVGLPNAGKSSILKALTKANPKIAGYPFTTLEPNLGVMDVNDKRKILVDVPGVVEEAWEGKGIGPWFLRHLERCEMLLHVLAPRPVTENEEQDNVDFVAQMVKDYQIVRKELEKFGNNLPEKKEVIVVNKRELIAQDDWGRVKKEMAKQTGREVVLVSAAMSEGLPELVELLK
ncbi:MAG: GTPase ObgE [bacterium]